MAIKFEVLRIGDKSDDGPNGECGIVIIGKKGAHSTGETVHCPTAHEHSKACAQALLDAKPQIGTAEDGTPILAESVREKLTARIGAHEAQSAAPRPQVAPMPKKAAKNDKGKDIMVDDLSL